MCSYGQRFTVTRLESPRPFYRDGEHYGAGETGNFREGHHFEGGHVHEGTTAMRRFGVWALGLGVRAFEATGRVRCEWLQIRV